MNYSFSLFEFGLSWKGQAPPNSVRTCSHCSDNMNRSYCLLFALFGQCELFALLVVRTVRCLHCSHGSLFALFVQCELFARFHLFALLAVRTVRCSHCSHRLFAVRWTLGRETVPCQVYFSCSRSGSYPFSW